MADAVHMPVRVPSCQRRRAALITAVLVTTTVLTSAPAVGAVAAAASCRPRTIELPSANGFGGRSEALAMNDRGWVVGNSETSASRYTATLWRHGQVFDLAPPEAVVPSDETYVQSSAGGVNESGAVTVTRTAFDPATQQSRASAWVWKQGAVRKLPAGKKRPFARVGDINDHGRAVGVITARAQDQQDDIPVMWSRGQLIRLPRPRFSHGGASAINNRGLIVGALSVRRGPYVPWFWRVGGRHGPLPKLRTTFHGYAADVDDRDRILGTQNERVAVWGGPRMRPRVPEWAQSTSSGAFQPTAMDNFGDVVGGRSSGFAVQASVWNMRDEPRPLTTPGEDQPWSIATAVIRGPTYYAPEGGISVAGWAADERGVFHAMLWTCAFRQGTPGS